MAMYNFIECSDNYSDSSSSLLDFKRDDVANNADVTNDVNDLSIKYKANLIGTTNADGTKKGEKNSCATKIFKIIRNTID